MRKDGITEDQGNLIPIRMQPKLLTSTLEVRLDFRPKKTGFTWKVQMRNPQLLKMVFLASAFLFSLGSSAIKNQKCGYCFLAHRSHSC